MEMVHEGEPRDVVVAQTSPWNSTQNAAAALSSAAGWMARRIGGVACEDALTLWATRTIRQSRGMVSLERLGAALGISRSAFAQRFRDRTGLAPKRFARIVRFHNALTLLGRPENIASVAAELGYYDQAHMYRDFEEFAGMTPGQLLSADRYPGSASLAES